MTTADVRAKFRDNASLALAAEAVIALEAAATRRGRSAARPRAAGVARPRRAARVRVLAADEHARHHLGDRRRAGRLEPAPRQLLRAQPQCAADGTPISDTSTFAASSRRASPCASAVGRATCWLDVAPLPGTSSTGTSRSASAAASARAFAICASAYAAPYSSRSSAASASAAWRREVEVGGQARERDRSSRSASAGSSVRIIPDGGPPKLL